MITLNIGDYWLLRGCVTNIGDFQRGPMPWWQAVTPMRFTIIWLLGTLLPNGAWMPQASPGNSVGHWNGDKCLKLNGDSRDSYIPQYLIVSVFCL